MYWTCSNEEWIYRKGIGFKPENYATELAAIISTILDCSNENTQSYGKIGYSYYDNYMKIQQGKVTIKTIFSDLQKIKSQSSTLMAHVITIEIAYVVKVS